MAALSVTIRRALRWHRPLMVLSGASLLLLVVCVVGLAVDGRTLVGDPIWLKPAKFAISIGIYATTLAWLLSRLRRWRRLGAVLGSIVAALAAGELAVIVVQVVRGQMSHFNYTTPLNAALFEAMAGMIVTLWVANLVAGVLFLRQSMGDAATSWAIRLGTAIALAGMAVAFFMPQPTDGQMQALERGADVGVIGAHSVGVPDGGPGLPITGWSTVGGDLRVPHFVGIHGLQVLILLALLLAALSGRYAVVRIDAVRLRIMLVTGVCYAGLLALTTWQALRGQSVVRPDVVTLAVAAALAVAWLGGVALAVRSRVRRTTPTPTDDPEAREPVAVP